MNSHRLKSSVNKEGIKDVEVSLVIGRVKWFNNEKGYGFIEYKENEDIFVHYSTINCDGYKTLSEGDNVKIKM